MMMKKTLGATVSAVLAVGASTMSATAATGVAVAPTPAQAAASSCSYVFLVAHQDDEVLSMGAAIRNHVVARGGNKVCVALMTTGEQSGARAIFDTGFVPYGQTKVYKNTQIAGSKELFSKARDREFIAATQQLGVPRANIYLDNLPGWTRVPDTGGVAFTKSAQTFTDAAIKRWGKVDYRGHSYLDPFSQHSDLGQALRNRSSQTNSVRHYYPQYQLASKPKTLSLGAERTRTANDQKMVRWAGQHYGVFNPSIGRYGIGWISVPQAFGKNALLVKRNGRTTPPIKKPNLAYLDTLSSYVHR